MYCCNCGVELANTEKKCPLCGVKAYHPDLHRPEEEGLYPDHTPKPRLKAGTVRTVIITMFLLPMLVTAQCDLLINNAITWSAYVIGALLLTYIVAILPTWFKKANPVIFVPCDFAALGLFLMYISYATGGKWFLSFAFPTLGAFGLVITAVVTLMRYVPRGSLYIYGGALLALGIYMPLMEYLISFTFGVKIMFWSVYPLTALVLLGGMLIFLAIVKPARETMERKFFI